MTKRNDEHAEECTVWNCNAVHRKGRPVVARRGYAALAKEIGL